MLLQSETKTGRVRRHRSGWPAGRVTGRVEILRPAGQAGWNTGQKQVKAKVLFFIKNSINKTHLFKTLVEWFQDLTNMLWPPKHAHPGSYLGGALCHALPLAHGTK